MTMVCRKEILQENQRYSLPFYFAIGILVCLLGLYGVVFAIDAILPTPLYIRNEAENPHRFIAESAYNILDGLVKIGPRLTGSVANEITAVNYLKKTIGEIRKDCPEIQDEDVDHQVVSGSFYMDAKPYGSINAYRNIQNVIVRLGARNNTQPSVLINAHFDTKSKSPGGSDDGIMCAVMLESIRKLCKLPHGKNNLLFLFNGAEELGLQASHGFITHPNKWNDTISVVVNLESAGAAVKETLFQTGPEQSWLMKYYSVVPHPHGQVFGEEMFQTGFIPSDTDFRIFRDFGNVVGYDIAYSRGGYRYHTEYDGIDSIPLETFQHTGDNVLALLQALGNAEEVSQPRAEPSNSVYYDFIGLFLIHYEETGEIAANVVTILFSIGIAIKAFFDFKLDPSLATLKYLSLVFASIPISWLVAIGINIALASSLDALNYCMGWYAHSWIIIWIYSLPAVTSLIGTNILMNRLIRYNTFKINTHAQVQLHANRLIWTLFLIIGTCLRVRSVYILEAPILFTSFAFLLIQLFQKQFSHHTWHFVYMTFTILPIMLIMYFSLDLFGTLVPMFGRIGSEVNTELLVGLGAAVITILIISFYLPIITISRKIFHVYIGLVITCVFCYIVFIVYYAIHSSSGYPYNRDVDTPYVSGENSTEANRTPQRYWIHHTKRIIRDSANNIIKEDAGMTYENMDRNTPRGLDDHVGYMSSISTPLKGDCDLALYCGLPVRHASSTKKLETHVWIPAQDAPIIAEPVHLTLESKSKAKNIVRYQFTANGTSNYNIYISPKQNMELVSTSLLEKIPGDQPKWKGQDTYFLLYLDGKSRENFHFNFDIKVPDNVEAQVDIAIAGSYCDEKVIEKSEGYKMFLQSFPPWTSVLACSGSYENWVY